MRDDHAPSLSNRQPRTDSSRVGYSPRVIIQQGAAGVCPLFCIPGAGASVTSFFDLAQCLGAHIPVHGLQPRGYDGAQEPFGDVPTAAHAYIRAIREVQPCGPYRLIGHSFGGWVAMEMAYQLLAGGSQMGTLVIIDSEIPARGAESHQEPIARTDILLELVQLFEMRLGRSIGLSARDFENIDHERQLSILLGKLVESGLFSPRAGIQVLRGIVKVFEANINTSYSPPGIYPGPLHFIEASEAIHDADAESSDAPDSDDIVAGWLKHAPQATFFKSPGNHMTMLMRPHVAVLARQLLQQLHSDASARKSPPA